MTQTLYSISFNVACQNLWKASKLPQIVADFAYKKQIFKLFTSSYIDKHVKKTDIALQTIYNALMNIDYLAFRLKVKLIAAIAGLNNDMIYCSTDIAGSLVKPLKQTIKFCVQNIVINKRGETDLSKSVLHIMEESNFKIEFDPTFLAHNCIKKTEVLALFKKVTKGIKKARTNKKRKCKKIKKNETKEYKDKIVENIHLMMESITYFWQQQRRLFRFDYDDPVFRYASEIQYISVVGSINSLKYYYELFLEEILQENDRQKHLMEVAKFAFRNNCFAEDKVYFFYEVLDSHLWDELVKVYFKDIFMCFLASWRYRDMCPQLFKFAVDHITLNMFRWICSEIIDFCNEERFQYHDVISIVQAIWLDTPNDLKQYSEISSVFVPEIIIPHADFESFTHFIKSYSSTKQKELLAHVIFALITTSKEHLIPKCLQTVEQLGLKVDNCRELLNIKEFKHFLLEDAKINRKSYDNMNNLAKYLCDDQYNENKLKKDLFWDRNFFVEYLGNLSYDKDLDKLLIWGLSDEEQVKQFKNMLFAKEWIHDAYDQRLVEYFDVEKADYIFKFLNSTQEEQDMVKKRVIENPEVVRMLYVNMIETYEFDMKDTYAKWLFKGKEEDKRFMEEFIYSSDGKNAIYDMFLNVPSLETNSTLRFSASMIMIRYLNFIDTWLKPFELVEKLDAMLEKNAAKDMKNLRVCVNGDTTLSLAEEQQAKDFCNAMYKGFRVLLKKEYSECDLHFMDHLNIIDMSARLAYEADIDIPKVI